jgi:hypothetical protein
MSTPYNISFACLRCCKSFKRAVDITQGWQRELPCPECGGSSYNVGRHFKPPNKSDKQQWEKVAYLLEHGFHFQKIHDQEHGGQNVPYPKTLKDAKEFVLKYKRYAIDKK